MHHKLRMNILTLVITTMMPSAEKYELLTVCFWDRSLSETRLWKCGQSAREMRTASWFRGCVSLLWLGIKAPLLENGRICVLVVRRGVGVWWSPSIWCTAYSSWTSPTPTTLSHPTRSSTNHFFGDKFIAIATDEGNASGKIIGECARLYHGCTRSKCLCVWCRLSMWSLWTRVHWNEYMKKKSYQWLHFSQQQLSGALKTKQEWREWVARKVCTFCLESCTWCMREETTKGASVCSSIRESNLPIWKTCVWQWYRSSTKRMVKPRINANYDSHHRPVRTTTVWMWPTVIGQNDPWKTSTATRVPVGKCCNSSTEFRPMRRGDDRINEISTYTCWYELRKWICAWLRAGRGRVTWR